MAACEKCWNEAYFRSRITGRLQADVYRDLLAENDDNPDHKELTDE